MDNVLTAVQGVPWRFLGEVLLTVAYYPRDKDISKEASKLLNEIEQQYHSDDDRLHAVVETWVQGGWLDKEPSWRCLIWRSDWEELSIADKIRNYAEPVLGESCSVPMFLYSALRTCIHIMHAARICVV